MTSTKSFGGLRALRRRLKTLLAKDWEEIPPKLSSLAPPKALISPLRTFFMDPVDIIRWHSISAFGQVVREIAANDMEDARVVMRQLMWTLNDESGGIGWGSPEAMGESMATTRQLCREYGKILLSYIWEEGNYLEYDALRIGALWGVMRASMAHPDIMNAHSASSYLLPYTNDETPMAQGLALLALKYLGKGQICDQQPIQSSHPPGALTIRIYLDGYFRTITI